MCYHCIANSMDCSGLWWDRASRIYKLIKQGVARSLTIVILFIECAGYLHNSRFLIHASSFRIENKDACRIHGDSLLWRFPQRCSFGWHPSWGEGIFHLLSLGANTSKDVTIGCIQISISGACIFIVIIYQPMCCL